MLLFTNSALFKAESSGPPVDDETGGETDDKTLPELEVVSVWFGFPDHYPDVLNHQLLPPNGRRRELQIEQCAMSCLTSESGKYYARFPYRAI